MDEGWMDDVNGIFNLNFVQKKRERERERERVIRDGFCDGVDRATSTRHDRRTEEINKAACHTGCLPV